MNERQEKILGAVVREYTKTAFPVGSEILARKYLLDTSSATIRNDMVFLEKEGFLYQPHISAGRIPTDQGYRYFVEEIMKEKTLSRKEQLNLQREILKIKAQNVRLSRTIAKLLSGLTGNLVISGILEKEEFTNFGMRELLNEPEFQELDEVCRLAETLDYVDEMFKQINKKIDDEEVKIFIGKENPIDKISSCSMIVAPYKTKSGETGILALIGPKRMEYARNKSLIEYIKSVISN